jgi:uncharacterized protein YcbX
VNELPVTLHTLQVYPIKSCAGVLLQESLLIETGLEFDRAWMVVDEHGEGLTRHASARLPLVQPTLRTYDMLLRAPGMLTLHLALDAVEAACSVRVWGHPVPAFDMGPIAAQWFSDFLGQRARLVRFDPDLQHAPAPRLGGGSDAHAAFANAFGLMVSSTASLELLRQRQAEDPGFGLSVEQFRPNLVLDGMTADQREQHAQRLVFETPEGPVALKLVGPSRCGLRAGAAVTEGFGMNAVIERGVEHLLRVGVGGRALLRA